jgi:N-acetylmuramoyl-L-alanine amidase
MGIDWIRELLFKKISELNLRLMLTFVIKLLLPEIFVKRSILFVALFITCCSSYLYAQTSADYKFKTIVLDAGHGGHDTGCRGAYSYEKDVTLAIIKKLGELIKKAYPDIKVIYTRETDTFVELYERANIANRNHADLFISIHCNATKSLTAYGTETWLMGLHKSEGNLDVSRRENDVILLEENYEAHYDGFDPNSPEGYIILSMNQNAHINQSINLASKVENEFSKDNRQSRGVKQAGFLVLWRTTMPSILIETGFLTNRQEEKYLTSESGRNEIAQSVLKAIVEYKAEVEGDFSQLKLVRDEENGDNNLIADTSGKIYVKQAEHLDSVNKTIEKGSNDSISKTNAGTIFKVQITASENLISIKDPRFGGIQDITIDKNDKGINRYVIGNYSSFQDCQNRLAVLRKKGYKDAFIVAYKEGNRIPLNQLP